MVRLGAYPLSGTRVFGVFSDMKPGDRLSVVVERDHVEHTAEIGLQPSPAAFNATANFATDLMVGIFLPWSCVLLGLYVALARPRDPLAWLVLMLLITFSQIVNGYTYKWGKWGEWIRVYAFAGIQEDLPRGGALGALASHEAQSRGSPYRGISVF